MGLLFIMHGMDGHAAPSAYFGKQVCLANQMVVVAMDWRNFGKTATQEKRGYIGSIETLIQDAEVICEIMAKKYKTQKIFLAGLSMGGGIAFQMAIRNKLPYRGIILFAPSIR